MRLLITTFVLNFPESFAHIGLSTIMMVIEPGSKRKTLSSWPDGKNKTTKTSLVVFVHCWNRHHCSVVHGYFFFVVFLAFLAGAFFLAGMVMITVLSF